ncbi:aldose 1-epimerase family protein [Tenacibaculum amylolyticum]|uniref:aldose 1-epimerase family protein n=1 Tax=Tenacibaculum amylolyticum TaxID=104269 RepID=UPI0038942256
MIVLENDQMQIALKTSGAELTRIYHKGTKIDYLWRIDERFWNRYAPVLFPIVGRLKDNTYTFEDTSYTFSQHGFARNNEFSIVSQSDTAITFELTDTPETLVNYPFKFSLRISYKLENDRLQVSYNVVNQDTKNIFFCIGGHPGFTCPLTPNTTFSDYFIEFETEETPQQHLLNTEKGLRYKKTETKALGKTIPLNYDLFTNDALIYEGLKSKKIKLKSHKHSHGISFEFDAWQFFAFWTKKDAPFICFEPWMGAADLENTNQEFVTKDGIIQLAIGDTYTNGYAIQFF